MMKGRAKRSEARQWKNGADRKSNITDNDGDEIMRVSRQAKELCFLSMLLILMTMILMVAVELNIMSIYYSFCQNLEFERRFGASNSDSRGRFS